MGSQNGEVLHSASSVSGTGGANLLPTNSISWNFVIFEFQDKETIAFHPIFLVSSSSHKPRISLKRSIEACMQLIPWNIVNVLPTYERETGSAPSNIEYNDT
jgi:hypothetical protein